MSFFYGFLGALSLVVLLVCGALAGWFWRKWYVGRTLQNPPEPGQLERQRLIEEQQAFRILQSYNAEWAYGMTSGDKTLGGEEV